MNSRTQNSSPSRAKPNLEIASSTPLEAIFVAKAGLNLPADQESDATRYADIPYPVVPVAAIAASTASPSRSTIVSIVAPSQMKGGASTT